MTLRYRLLGKSGLRVSELCLGTMTFGAEWGWGADEDESRRQFDAFTEAGGNFIDTANLYTGGTSERYVGRFVADDRDRFVVATKYTMTTDQGDPNGAGNSRKNMMRCIDGSLERMGLDHLDLFWLHAWDGTTPIEEVLRGMDDLVRQGKVHHYGFSNTPAWVVARAHAIAEARGWTPPVAYQGRWSLAERGIEREVVPMARTLDLTVTPWGCLGGGILTGKYGSRKKDGEARRQDTTGWEVTQHQIDMGEAVVAVAAELDATPAQVALAWVRSKNENTVPLLGGRRASQIEEALGCVDVALPAEVRQRLDEASAFEAGYPNAFLADPHIRGTMSANTEQLLVDHHRYGR